MFVVLVQYVFALLIIQVSVSNKGSFMEKWRVSDRETERWVKATAHLPTDTQRVVITGVVGDRKDYIGSNYIAIDDIMIKECGKLLCIYFNI